MKIPLDWLKEYVNIKGRNAKDVAASFTSLGLMLDKPAEDYENGKYKTEVLDLEHRMDRSDWLSIIGCARDLAAFDGIELKYPEVHLEKGAKLPADEKVKIKVECKDLVNRFNTRVFKNIKVEESPDWLKNRLEAYGIPSKNNVVDITNYIMVEYGQPMHAQDLDKMNAREIVIRRAKDGEKIVTLLGETVELTKDQFVLTQAGEATVIGGIVGGNTTGVDETTTEIVLDAGNYNQYNIRKSSRALKIQNETVARYDKFLHPELTQKAIERATYLILELAGGEYYENEDWYPKEHEETKMILRYSRVEQIGGMDLGKERIKEILEALEYSIVSETEDALELVIPFFRTDVVVEDDIVSDIYRINDYSKIPVKLIGAAPPAEITPEIYNFENSLREIVTSLGFHEHITDPMVQKNESVKGQVVLSNALTSDKSAMRTTLRETLLPVVNTYKKHKIDEIRLFEIARTYEYNGKGTKHSSYKENKVLEVLYRNASLSSYEAAKNVKGVLANVLNSIGIEDYTLENAESEIEIKIGGTLVGRLDMFGFSLFTEELLPLKRNSTRVTSDLHSYTVENLSLVMNLDQKLGPVYDYINGLDEVVSLRVLEEYTGDRIGDNQKTVLVEITYNTSDTQKIRTEIIKTLKSKYKIEHRD